MSEKKSRRETRISAKISHALVIDILVKS